MRPRIKLVKFHCFWAGLIRAGAIYGKKIKGIETRKTSIVFGQHYRGWVAIGSTKSPKKPDAALWNEVAQMAAKLYGEEWLVRLSSAELYKPAHILAVARVKATWEMTQSNLTACPLERLVGNWQPGRFATELEDVIAPLHPIPYEIRCQGTIYLKPCHNKIYDEVMELLPQK